MEKLWVGCSEDKKSQAQLLTAAMVNTHSEQMMNLLKQLQEENSNMIETEVPVMAIREDTFRNTWNLVFIGSCWLPISCNWGPRTQTLEDLHKYKYKYNKFYFLTNPDNFIHMLQVDDEEKQLLKAPVTLEQFVYMPFVKSKSFTNGLQFDPPVKSVLYTYNKGNTEVKVRLSFAKDIQFQYHLLHADCKKRSDTELHGAKLKDFVFHSIVDGLALSDVQVPEPGTFSLILFVSTLDAGSLKEACTFRIVCEKSTSEACPLLNCTGTNWGPRRGEHTFGFKALTHRDGIVSVSNDLEMNFKLPTKVSFICQLYKNGVEDSTLKKFVSLSVSDDVLTVKVNPPQSGQYGLEIYAQKEDAAEKNSYAYACKYLLNVARRNETTTSMASMNSIG